MEDNKKKEHSIFPTWIRISAAVIFLFFVVVGGLVEIGAAFDFVKNLNGETFGELLDKILSFLAL